jgi:hypothetical protein
MARGIQPAGILLQRLVQHLLHLADFIQIGPDFGPLDGLLALLLIQRPCRVLSRQGRARQQTALRVYHLQRGQHAAVLGIEHRVVGILWLPVAQINQRLGIAPSRRRLSAWARTSASSGLTAATSLLSTMLSASVAINGVILVNPLLYLLTLGLAALRLCRLLQHRQRLARQQRRVLARNFQRTVQVLLLAEQTT